MTLASVEQEVEHYISENGDLSEFSEQQAADLYGEARKVIWVVKYIPHLFDSFGGRANRMVARLSAQPL